MDEKDVLLKIGRNICAERNRLGLSQEGLAALISINVRNLGKIERGQANPKITTIIRIMKVLNLSFEALYNEV